MLRFAARIVLRVSCKRSSSPDISFPLRDRMFRYAHSLLLSSDEAEGCRARPAGAAVARSRGLDACRNLSAFVLTAVRNRCYDRLRQLRTVRAHAATAGSSTAERTTTGAIDDAGRRAIWSAGPSRGLPERQREVLPEGYRGVSHPRDRGVARLRRGAYTHDSLPCP